MMLKIHLLFPINDTEDIWERTGGKKKLIDNTFDEAHIHKTLSFQILYNW